MSAKSLMQKAVEIYLLLFASVHLLYFGFSGYKQIFEAKKVTFCVITSLLFLCAVISIFIYIFREKKDILKYIKQKASPTRICALAYLLVTLISGVISSRFPETIFGVSRFEGMFTISYYVFSFLLVSLFPCRKKYIFTVFSVCVTIFSVICVIQISGLNPLSLYPDGMNFYDAGRLYTTAFIGTIGNTNLSGAFICLALPFIFTMMVKSKDKARLLLIIPVSLLAYTVLKMDVISTVIGLGTAFLLLYPMIFGFNRKRCIIYFAVIIALIVTAVFIIYLYPPKTGFLLEVSQILHGNTSETFGSGRIRIWKNVLGEIPESPIFGKGVDTMRRENFTPFERYYPDLSRVMKTTIDCAHSEPLNILYHQGILGLFAYLGFIFYTLRTFWKNKNDILILSLGAAFVCYLVQSLFTFSMCLVAPYFWICAGIIESCNSQNRVN